MAHNECLSRSHSDVVTASRDPLAEVHCARVHARKATNTLGAMGVEVPLSEEELAYYTDANDTSNGYTPHGGVSDDRRRGGGGGGGGGGVGEEKEGVGESKGGDDGYDDDGAFVDPDDEDPELLAASRAAESDRAAEAEAARAEMLETFSPVAIGRKVRTSRLLETRVVVSSLIGGVL